jgi:hypothetical protein
MRLLLEWGRGIAGEGRNHPMCGRNLRVNSEARIVGLAFALMHGKGCEMSDETSNGTEPSVLTASAMPTGYRVSVVPCAIEVSARLGAPGEVRELIKVLRAAILIFATDGDVDIPENFTHRVAAIRAASLNH